MSPRRAGTGGAPANRPPSRSRGRTASAPEPSMISAAPPAKFKNDLFLATGWRISRVRASLRARDRPGLIEFIRHRHTERFFEPIRQLQIANRNQQGYGFAMMALCSLLIETIQ